MTTVLAPIADIEMGLITWVRALGWPGLDPTNVIGRGAPEGSTDYPLVRITRTGGPSAPMADHPFIDIEIFDLTRNGARDLAVAIDAAVLGAPYKAGGIVVDAVESIAGPFSAPWADPGVRRFIATYQPTVRR